MIVLLLDRVPLKPGEKKSRQKISSLATCININYGDIHLILSTYTLGSLFNYVDQILPIIDHLPTPVDIGESNSFTVEIVEISSTTYLILSTQLNNDPFCFRDKSRKNKDVRKLAVRPLALISITKSLSVLILILILLIFLSSKG